MDSASSSVDKGGGDIASGAKSRNTLENLTKEELLNKCKHLITIAQKAKLAKDDTVTELAQTKQRATSEQDALMEMVDNLTEGKVALITKTESLQRQLTVTSSELEAVQASQTQLIGSRQEAQDRAEAHEAKIRRIKDRFQTIMQEETEKQDELLEEKEQLMSKVENLEAQNRQMDVIKTKCKKLLEEKNKLEASAKDIKALQAEMKASDIVLQDTKNQKKLFEEKAQKFDLEIKDLKVKNESSESVLERQALEMDELKKELTLMKEVDENREKDIGESDMLVLQLKSEVEEYTIKCVDLQERVNKFQEQHHLTETTEEITESVTLIRRNSSDVATSDENLQSEIMQLKNTIAELQTSYDDTKKCSERLTELEGTVEKQDDDKNSLEQMLFDANEKYSQYESEIQTLKQQFNEKEADLTSASTKYDSLLDENRSLNEKLCEKDECYKKLTDDYSIVTNELQTSRSTIDKLNEENTKNITNMEILLSERNEAIAELKNKNLGLEQSLKDLEIQVDKHMKELHDVNINISSSLNIPGMKDILEYRETSSAEISASDTVINKLNFAKDIFENYHLIFKESSSQFGYESDKIKSELTSMTEQKMLLQRKLDETKLEYEAKEEALQAKWQVSNDLHVSLTKEHQCCLSTAADLGHQKEKLTAENDILRQNIGQTDEKNYALNERICELNDNAVKLRDEFRSRDDSIQEFDGRLKEMEVLQETLNSKEQSFHELQETLAQERSSFNEVLATEKSLQDELHNKLSQLTESEASSKELIRSIQDSQKHLEIEQADKDLCLENKILELQTKCSDYESETGGLREKIVQYCSENNILKDQEAKSTRNIDIIQELQSQLKDLQIVEADYKEQVSRQQLQVQELELKLKDLQIVEADYKEQVSRQHLQVQELELKLKDLQIVEADYKEQVSRQQLQVQDLELKLKQMHNQIVNLREQSEGVGKEFKTVKEEKEQYNCQLIEAQNEITELKLQSEIIKEEIKQMKKMELSVNSQLSDIRKEKEDIIKEICEVKVLCTKREEKISIVEQENEILREERKAIGIADNSRISDLTKEKGEIDAKLKNSENENLEVCIELKDSVSEIKKLNLENEELNNKFADSINEKKKAIDNNDSLTTQLTEVFLERDKLLKDRDELTISSDACRQQITTKTEQCRHLEEENIALKLIQEQTRAKFEEGEENLKTMKETTDDLNTRLKERCAAARSAEDSVKEAEARLAESDAKHGATVERCEELLQELNEVTAVLRERGERISRLEATLKQRSAELDGLTAQLSQLAVLQEKMRQLEAEKAALQSELQATGCEEDRGTVATAGDGSRESDLQQKLDVLQQTVDCMAKEKEQFRKSESSLQAEKSSVAAIVPSVAAVVPSVAAVVPSVSAVVPSAMAAHAAVAANMHATECQSEVMSNSTTSKAEDLHRLKDLEDTFEERYMKLKSVAIKLKKKLAEQTIQLNASEELKNKLLLEKEQLAPVKTASKNIQILQGEIDRLQDSVEGSGRAIKERDSQLLSAARQLAEAKEQLVQQLQDLELLRGTVKSLEETTALQKSKEAELQSKIITLRDEASGLEEKDSKQRSLLNLELQDSERTIAELRCQLTDQEAATARDKQELATLQQRVAALDIQLEHVTAQHAADEGTAQHLRKSSEELRLLLSELEREVLTLRVVRQQQAVEIERLLQEVEYQKMSVTEVSQAKTQVEELARSTSSRANKQISSLEDRLETVATDLQQTSDELQQVNREFEGYKARAQSVLKQQQQQQQQQVPAVDVVDLQYRLKSAETQQQSLQHSNRHLQSELSALQSEHKFQQSEKERTSRQQKQDAEQTARHLATLQEEAATLKGRLVKVTVDGQAVVTKMAAEGEAMANSYEGQLKSRATAHQEEVSDLHCQLDAVNRKLQDASSCAVGAGSAAVGAGSGAKYAVHHRVDSGDTVDVTTMVREAGEGSEFVEPTPFHKHTGYGPSGEATHGGGGGDPYHPPPLHQLLSTHASVVSLANASADDNISVTGSAADQQYQHQQYQHSTVAALQAKVEAVEVRVQQVASLLHESEAENAKLAQLTDALKEEIRRGSRNTDREKHLENLEYLKNVVLQFVTIGDSGNEGRERLLPVLTTLLQLSPQEVKKIKSVVKDDGGEGSAAGQGWGSYLHMWSGR